MQPWELHGIIAAIFHKQEKLESYGIKHFFNAKLLGQYEWMKRPAVEYYVELGISDSRTISFINYHSGRCSRISDSVGNPIFALHQVDI